MRQKIKTVERMVKLLKDPEPRFVSIVDHGANQTPWAALKRVKPPTAQGAIPMKIKRRIPLAGKTPTVKVAEVKTGVRKLVFDGAQFASVEAVEKYLKADEWEGYTVVETDKGFEAAGEGVTDDQFSDLRTVEGVEEGVSAVVGAVKATETKTDDPARVTGKGEVVEEATETETKADEKPVGGDAPVSEVKQAFDGWSAYLSSETTLAGVLKDGMADGLPPGFDAIMLSASTAIGNILRDEAVADKTARVAKVGADMATAINAAYDVFSAIIATEEVNESVTETMKAFAKKQIDAFTEKAAKAAKPDVQTTAPDITAAVTAALTSALAPVNKALTDLSGKVDTIGNTAKEAKDLASKASVGVTSLAARAPTKKAANETDPEGDSGAVNARTEDNEAVLNRKFAEKLRRNMFAL